MVVVERKASLTVASMTVVTPAAVETTATIGVLKITANMSITTHRANTGAGQEASQAVPGIHGPRDPSGLRGPAGRTGRCGTHDSTDPRGPAGFPRLPDFPRNIQQRVFESAILTAYLAGRNGQSLEDMVVSVATASRFVRLIAAAKMDEKEINEEEKEEKEEEQDNGGPGIGGNEWYFC